MLKYNIRWSNDRQNKWSKKLHRGKGHTPTQPDPHQQNDVTQNIKNEMRLMFIFNNHHGLYEYMCWMWYVKNSVS